MVTAQTPQRSTSCCPYYHEAVELIGRRWTGAILAVLMREPGPLRFSEIAGAVPQLSDRLLSERVKELEARGLLAREMISGPPVRVEYALTPMGRSLAPALDELAAWARRWLEASEGCAQASESSAPPAQAVDTSASRE